MTNQDGSFNPKTAVYTPPEASDYAIRAVQRVKDEQKHGIRMFVPEIDNYFAPMLPGQICAVLGQTSNYKSGFLHAWEHHLALKLIEDGRTDEVIIHVSLEESVEEQIYYQLARYSEVPIDKIIRGDIQDWKKLQDAAIKVGSIPIYRIGDSLARAEDMPNLYLSNMIRSIKVLVNGDVTGEKITPAAIFFDYLQAFPIDPEVRSTTMSEQRRLQVRGDIYRLRQASALFNCPIIVGVQAKQSLSGAPGKDFLIPGMYDGEESASIAQRCDRIVSLWMPARTHMVGTQIDHNNISFIVAEDDLWVRIVKQRGGFPAGKAWHCKVDFRTNIIKPAILSKHQSAAFEEQVKNMLPK